MNRKLFLLLATGGAVLLFAADGPKKEVTEIDRLKAKVMLLEGRIDQLDARLNALAQTRPAAFEPALTLPPKTEVPPNVGEIEVNGLKIYKVPLSQAR